MIFIVAMLVSLEQRIRNWRVTPNYTPSLRVLWMQVVQDEGVIDYCATWIGWLSEDNGVLPASARR
jgi:hypothetical protein